MVLQANTLCKTNPKGQYIYSPIKHIQLEIAKGTKLKLLSCYTIEGSIQQQTQSPQPLSYEVDLERRYHRNFLLLGDDSGLRSASEMFQL
jgi:hypothetical protein